MVIQDKVTLSVSQCAQLAPNENEEELIKFQVPKVETKFILLAGKPIKEPIVHHGPFVLNEQEELFKAFDDYQKGQNGFEGANTWQSEIQHLRHKSRTN